jgi:hypothetical protein
LGIKKDEVTLEWRKLHNRELYDPSFSPTIIRVIKLKSVMGGACGTYGRQYRYIQGFGGET